MKSQEPNLFQRIESLESQIDQLQTIVDHLDDRINSLEKQRKQDSTILDYMFLGGK